MSPTPPGPIKTEPNAKIVYNAPFTEKNVYNVRLTNNGAHRIGWAVETTNTWGRLAAEPQAGVLDPNEVQRITISCEPFDFSSVDTGKDRISFKWTDAPEGAPKEFDHEWFDGEMWSATDKSHRTRQYSLTIDEDGKEWLHPPGSRTPPSWEHSMRQMSVVHSKNLHVEYNP